MDREIVHTDCLDRIYSEQLCRILSTDFRTPYTQSGIDLYRLWVYSQAFSSGYSLVKV